MSMENAVADAVNRGELELGDRKITVVIPGPDGQPTELELFEPTIEQIAWISTLASGRAPDMQKQIKSMSDLMEDLMEPEVNEDIWRRLRNRHDPLKMEHVADAVAAALEAVQDFPTQPSSDSSPSSPPAKPGKRSTGRAAGPGSTASPSRRAGS